MSIILLSIIIIFVVVPEMLIIMQIVQWLIDQVYYMQAQHLSTIDIQ